MGLSIDAKITGNKVLDLKLKKLAVGVQDLRPAFEEMEPNIVKEFKDNFSTGGSTLGRTWPPRVHSYPWPILNKTGKMMGAWGSTVQRLSMKVFNKASYSKYHHFGTTRLPVRLLVGFNSKIKKDIIGSVTRYIKTLIK